MVAQVLGSGNWRRQWQPTPVFLAGESQGLGSLVGCRLWGCTELEMTERLHYHFSLLCIGEGNGNPLQCSCLENPRDGVAWWAAIYGVTQSQTRLKRPSSSSSSRSQGCGQSLNSDLCHISRPEFSVLVSYCAVGINNTMITATPLRSSMH